ncbi:MAG: DUF1127 domain-containing protein [Rhodobacteraceae bacterium]|jgi:uncharacterized protein YjiS (DUF1127 family)|uniref:YjiS-like domain-containing protein n=1 Tax=Salipiger profundus TaxID=1229727 RepID=A0A1U7D7N1_9RHOB|nr:MULTISPECIES: DUF1127 domain-containing protein [Salipiger]APX24075.1 hypothetical protein Ga0080559_TMP3279 [Salipiger profundus]MAB06867.1 DUF1127 domain-containing protein [Paracoccaceae bacterium]GFZ94495.1 hypothetical protein GCM10011326_01560 [Salipiger profundus]SFB91892.1 Uncharacterized conserved protein YjiS, DUF1127 family [Salipiger profundus]
MAYATDHTANVQAGNAGFFSGIVASLRERNARRRLFKETVSELSGLSNRELSDLGLSRSMIRRIAWQAAYEA